MFLRELLERYSFARTNLSQLSLDQIRYSITAFEKFVGHPVEIADCTESLVGKFVRYRLATVSKETAKRNLANVMTLLRWAAKKNLTVHPLPEIEPVRVNHSTPTAWDIHQLAAIVDTCNVLPGRMRDMDIPRRLWWMTLILFLYDTGSRISAALSVCWRDVSLDRRLVTLRGETAKTGAEQLVSISDDTAGLLESLRRSPADLVWPYPWERRRLWLDLHEILGAAEIDGRSIGFHRIRKTHATQVVALLGWDAARVALGHTDETMTRRYVDLRQIPRQEIALPRPKAR